MKKVALLMAALSLLFLTGCADSVSFTTASDKVAVGFWHGLWHGLIIPISWIVSLFSESTAIYAIYNNGGWYDFGFFWGVSLTLGGGSTTASSSRKKTRP